jgi:hypothetical protein
MEHAGATITTIHALSHELCHSWFGRGVLPADGRSGWIDEAITTWRDVLYQRDSNFLTFPSTNLSNYSIWHKGAPGLPHLAGKDLLSGIDALMADQGGLLPIVRAFYTDWLHKPVTTEQFLSYLEARSGLSLATEIDKYVYGEGCHTDDFCQ